MRAGALLSWSQTKASVIAPPASGWRALVEAGQRPWRIDAATAAGLGAQAAEFPPEEDCLAAAVPISTLARAMLRLRLNRLRTLDPNRRRSTQRRLRRRLLREGTDHGWLSESCGVLVHRPGDRVPMVAQRQQLCLQVPGVAKSRSCHGISGQQDQALHPSEQP
jgi:hypothetical protein